MTTASPAAGISPEFIDQVRAKLARTTVEHYINGQWTEGARGETFETLDPSTNRVLARAWRGHSEDIDRAAQAAHAAFQKWGHSKAKDRKKYLLKIAGLIEKHGDEIRQDLTAELAQQTDGLVTDVQLENNIYEITVTAVLSNGKALELRPLDIDTLAEDYPDCEVGY